MFTRAQPQRFLSLSGFFLLLLSLLASLPAQANPIDAHELHIVELITSGAGNGYLSTRSCEDCRLQRLPLSADTKLLLNGRALPPRDAWRLRGRGGVVRIDRSTGRVIDVRARH